MKIFIIAGARPNFMKIAPIIRAFKKHTQITYKLIHTGQHYDENMSSVFFSDLGIEQPHYFLGANQGSHAIQTAKIMVEFEEICRSDRPDLVMVVGDVNSTLACSIVAKKEHIKLAHVEAGLRSFDILMPEEINRIVTDSITDIFFVTEENGLQNLISEGKNKKELHFVGNVMIDNLYYQLEKLNSIDVNQLKSNELKGKFNRFGVVTLHRPSNVDDPDVLKKIFEIFDEVSNKLPLIFPMHPRTRKSINKFNLSLNKNINVTFPLSYMEFLNIWKDAKLVLTDSGGLQEETTALGVPCLTLRNNTERPITISKGTNSLVGTSKKKIIHAVEKINKGSWKEGEKPDLWDGNSADRIIDILLKS